MLYSRIDIDPENHAECLKNSSLPTDEMDDPQITQPGKLTVCY